MTTPNYTLIGSALTRAARPIWMLEELGVPYEHQAVKPLEPEVTDHYPRGKVPVLLVDGEAVTDSTAIMQFLADRHGQFTAPAGTVARAKQDAMTQAILDELDAVLWTASRHSFILPTERRVPEVKESLRWEFDKNLANIAARMGDGPYVCGDEMTVPDFVLEHCLLWAKSAKFEIKEPKMLDYHARMKTRPAMKAALSKG